MACVMVQGLSEATTYQTLGRALGDLFGPVKRVDVIRGRGFGFVRFASEDEARRAITNARKQPIHVDGRQVTMVMARSKQQQPSKPPQKVVMTKQAQAESVRVWGVPFETTTDKQAYKRLRKLNGFMSLKRLHDSSALLHFSSLKTAIAAVKRLDGATLRGSTTRARLEAWLRKATPRLIVRNLSFATTDEDFRCTFDKFGPLKDCTVVRSQDGTSRGFGFVEFYCKRDANAVLTASNNFKISGREVAVDTAMGKDEYKHQLGETRSPATEAQNAKGEPQAVIDELEKLHGKADADGEHNSHQQRYIGKDCKGEEEGNNDEEDNIDEEDHNDDEDNIEEEDHHDDEDNIEEEDHDDGEDHNAQHENDDVEDRNDDEHSADKGRIDNDDDTHDADDVQKRLQAKRGDAAEGRTLFVRNLPYGCAVREIRALFASYGSVESCHIVKDKVTGLARGTAFVKMTSVDDVHKAIGMISFQGRELRVMLALPEGVSAPEVQGPSKRRKLSQTEDKRRLHLVDEGLVARGTPAAFGVPEAELTKREEARAAKQRKLTNPLFFVNPTRLSVRNLNDSVDNRTLRSLCSPATSAKVICKENGTSRGFGFAEFADESAALQVLRRLNNNPKYARFAKPAPDGTPRLIVDHAVENKIKADQRAAATAAGAASKALRKTSTKRAREEPQEVRQRSRQRKKQTKVAPLPQTKTTVTEKQKAAQPPAVEAAIVQRDIKAAMANGFAARWFE